MDTPGALRVPKDYFGESVALRYGEDEAEMFDRAVGA